MSPPSCFGRPRLLHPLNPIRVNPGEPAIAPNTRAGVAQRGPAPARGLRRRTRTASRAWRCRAPRPSGNFVRTRRHTSAATLMQTPPCSGTQARRSRPGCLRPKRHRRPDSPRRCSRSRATPVHASPRALPSERAKPSVPARDPIGARHDGRAPQPAGRGTQRSCTRRLAAGEPCTPMSPSRAIRPAPGSGMGDNSAGLARRRSTDHS